MFKEEYSAAYPPETQKQLVDSNIASAYCTNNQGRKPESQSFLLNSLYLFVL